MTYDYILKIGADVDDITPSIISEIKKADGAKIRVKCEDKDIKKVLAQLSKIDEISAQKIMLDVNGDDVAKTLTQIRNDAHKRIAEIKNELSKIDIDSENLKLSQKKKELDDTKNKAYKKKLEEIKDGIYSLSNDLGSDTKSEAYKSKAKSLLNLVETYKKAGGDMSEIEDRIKNIIGSIDNSISGTAKPIEFSRPFQKEIEEMENAVREQQLIVDRHKALMQEYAEYKPFLDGYGGSGSGTGSGFSINDEDLKELKGLLDSIDKAINSIANAFGEIDGNSNLQSLIKNINGINSSLEKMREIFVDIGDGQEFSPLFKILNELKNAISGIRLNINLDTNINDEQATMKIEGRKQELLRAYQEQFYAMKNHKVGGKDLMASRFSASAHSIEVSNLNRAIAEFDESAYDNIEQKIKAYENIIKRMRDVAKLVYGKDIYDNIDDNYQKQVTRGKSNLTRAQKSLGKNSVEEINNLFGGSNINLDGLSLEIDRVCDKLQEMIDLLKSVFAIKVDVDTENVNSEFINLLSVLNDIKQVITDINTIRSKSEVSSVVGNIENEIGNATQEKKDFANANKDVQDSVDDSKSKLQLEADLMEDIAEKASEAANAKKDFVEANEEVKDSTENTNSSMKKSKKKDKYAKRNKVSEEEFLNNSNHYSSIANEELKNSGRTILGETVSTELLENGLVKVNAKIKDVDGTWKTFSAKIDADGNMFEQKFKTITKGVDRLETELENFSNETSEPLTYQQTLDKAQEIKNTLKLGDDFTIKVDSNELVTITKKLSDVDDAGTNVVQTFKSAKDAIENFGKAESNLAEKTTITVKSKNKENDSLEKKEELPPIKKEEKKEKEEVLSLKKAKELLINTEKEYQELKSNNSKTDEEIAKLEELTKKRKQANEVLNTNAINRTSEIMKKLEVSNDSEVFANAFEQADIKIKDLNNQLGIGKISLEEYNQEIKEIKDNLDRISKSNIMLTNFKENIGDSELLSIAFNNASEKVDELNKKLQNGDTSLDNYNNGVKKIKNSLDAIANSNVILNNFKTFIGDDASLVTVFNNVYAEVSRLNNELQNGSISLAEYKKNISNINNGIEASKNAVAFAAPNDIDAAKSAMEKYAREVSNSRVKLKDAKIDANNLTFEWKDQNGSIQRLTLSYNELTGAITETQTQLSQTEKQTKSLSERIKQGWLNVAQYAASFMSFYEIINLFRTGVSVIRELDTALTEMRKVSDETISSLREFQDVSFDIAKSIGSTAQQIQNSAADFMRLGYSLKEASELAKDANIYANVGDMEIEEATEHMISSIQAWKSEFSNEVEASEAIIDRYNEIGNNFAISSAEIGSAMERSAAALKAGGNTLNESLGLITAGNVIQQDAETTAAALKILSLRIRGAKADLEEMGESTDGLASSTSKMRNEIKALTGIDIMLDENNFKSTAQIIQELGAVWENLSDVSQASTLELLAGKNRASTVAGLLENYEIIDDVIKSAEKAEGSALKENERYLESIEGKLQLLQNEWQEFWYNLIDSEVVKDFIDAGIDLANIMEDILSAITESGALNLVTNVLTGAIDLVSSLTNGLGKLSGVLAVVLGGSLVKKIKGKDSGGRDKKFSLVIKYATESFSREVCEF